MKPTILITGASSGIGLKCALALSSLGYRVFGTSRNTPRQAIEAFQLLTLDVRDNTSVQRCVQTVIDASGGIDILINNAGYAVVGGCEETHEEELRAQFETNFFGATRMVNAVLPTMRKQNSGKIINLGSLVGFAAIPFLGAYSASKFALHGYSEALFHELQPLGISVSLVQPGMVKTNFFGHAIHTKHTIDKYTPWQNHARESITDRSQNGISTDTIVSTIVNICESPRPGFVYRVGKDAKLVNRLKRILPSHIFNTIWHKQFGLNRVKTSI